MSLTNPKTVVTEERLAEFYQRILPYLGQGSSGDSENGGHTIKDEGIAVTQRDTLDFTDFDIEDNSTDEETDVAPHRLTAGEMAEIVSPLPTVPVKGINYSTEEQVIGKWIDGKPLYQKTFVYDGNIAKNTELFKNELTALNINWIQKVAPVMFYTDLHWESEYAVTSNDFLLALLENGGVDGTTVYLYVNYGTTRTSITKLILTVQYTKTTDVVL